MAEHMWPPELVADATCERCGLPYRSFCVMGRVMAAKGAW